MSSTDDNTPQPVGEGSLELAPGVVVLASLVSITFAGSRGPGGQNVNKRSTRAVLRISVADIPVREPVRARLRTLAGSRLTESDEVVISSDEHKSQRRNRDECLKRLRELIIEARHVPRKRVATRPTRGSVRRRLDEKKRRGEVKKLRKPPGSA